MVTPAVGCVPVCLVVTSDCSPATKETVSLCLSVVTSIVRVAIVCYDNGIVFSPPNDSHSRGGLFSIKSSLKTIYVRNNMIVGIIRYDNRIVRTRDITTECGRGCESSSGCLVSCRGMIAAMGCVPVSFVIACDCSRTT
jgi:hypothetical protein